MSISSIGRRISTIPALGILLLACAVFGWGLHYKLSLYGPASRVPQSTPQAKLLSEKDRRASSKDQLTQKLASTPPQSIALYSLLLLGAIAAGLPYSTSMWMRIANFPEAQSQQQIAHLNYFSFRPPPASTLSC